MTATITDYLMSKGYFEITGSGTMWDGFRFGRPGLYAFYNNEFTDWIADSWTVTEVGTSLQTIVDVENGVLRLTSGGTEDDGSNCQLGGTGDSETVGESFAPVAARNLYFETRIKSDSVTQHDFFLGLHVQDTTIIASRGADYIGFRTDDGDTALDIESASGSSASDATSVYTLANDTWVKLGFKVTGTSTIDFWIDDALVRTISTDIPTALMRLSMAHLTGSGAAVQLDIDYIRCYQQIGA